MRGRRAQLVGHVVIGLLLGATWAAYRYHSEAETIASTPTATPAWPVPVAPSGVRRRWRKVIVPVAAVGVPGSAMLILWRRFHISLPSPSPLQLFIATGVLFFFIVVLVVLPQLIAPSRAPSDLVDDPNLESKDRIQLSDDRRKLQNDVRAALFQAIGGGALVVGLFFTWQQQHTTSQQVARQLEVTR